MLYTLQGAYPRSLGCSACMWIYDRSCDARLVQSLTYGYLPSAEHCHCPLTSTHFRPTEGRRLSQPKWLVIIYRGCIRVNGHASQY